MGEQKKQLIDLKFKDFLEALPGHVYWKDINGAYLGCNKEQARFFGFDSVEEFVGKTDFDVQPKETAEKVWSLDQEVMRSGRAVSFEEVALSVKGKAVRFLSHKTPLYDDENNIIGLLGMSSDVTEFKDEADAHLKEREKIKLTLDTVVNNLPEHVYWLDCNNIFLGCNRKQAETFALSSPEEIIGKTVYDFETKEDADRITENNNEVMRENKRISFEESYMTPQGECKEFLSVKVPLRENNGEVIGLIGISMDITDRKRMELELKSALKAAEAANEAKTAFVANMAHDVRTPLTGSIGLSSELEKDAESERDRERGRLLSGALWQLSHLFDEIIDSMKLESGQIEDQLGTFSLRGLIHRNIVLQAPAVKKNNLRLMFDCSETVPDTFEAPYHLLDRIVLNLLANAIKFTEQGQVDVSVKHDGNILEVIIKDTGIGIPQDKLKDIFGKFTRLSPSYRAKYKGAGLGLYAVDQYLDRLGGDITVESEEGVGSTFAITLPLIPVTTTEEILFSDIEFPQDLLEASSEQNVTASKKAQVKAPVHANGFSILLVEDDERAARMIESVLLELGYQVAWADTGEAGLEAASQQTFDLIITDIGLPGIQGTEVAEQLRAMSAYKSTPILALTGHGADTYRDRCVEVGMNDILVKPLGAHAAQKILDHYLSAKTPSGKDKIIDLEKSISVTGKESTSRAGLEMLNETLLSDQRIIEQHFEHHAYDEMYKAVHKLKGSLGYLGVPKLEAAAVALNQTLAEASKANFKQLDIKQLQAELEAVKQQVAAFLKAYSAFE